MNPWVIPQDTVMSVSSFLNTPASSHLDLLYSDINRFLWSHSQFPFPCFPFMNSVHALPCLVCMKIWVTLFCSLRLICIQSFGSMCLSGWGFYFINQSWKAEALIGRSMTKSGVKISSGVFMWVMIVVCCFWKATTSMRYFDFWDPTFFGRGVGGSVSRQGFSV